MDQTWKKSYPVKPEWWDDETQPRCDECGIHCEDTERWCGECGNCETHCQKTSDCEDYWKLYRKFFG